MKVVIIAWWAGHIDRGVESVAWNFKRRLPFETIVASSHSTDWTLQVPGKKYKIWRRFIEIAKRTGLYWWLWQIDKLIPWFDLFIEDFFDTLSLCRNMEKTLNNIQPDMIINLGGTLTGLYLKKYRKKYKVPFVSVNISGKCRTEIKNARHAPDCYVAITPSQVEFIHDAYRNLPIQMIPIGG